MFSQSASVPVEVLSKIHLFIIVKMSDMFLSMRSMCCKGAACIMLHIKPNCILKTNLLCKFFMYLCIRCCIIDTFLVYPYIHIYTAYIHEEIVKKKICFENAIWFKPRCATLCILLGQLSLWAKDDPIITSIR